LQTGRRLDIMQDPKDQVGKSSFYFINFWVKILMFIFFFSHYLALHSLQIVARKSSLEETLVWYACGCYHRKQWALFTSMDCIPEALKRTLSFLKDYFWQTRSGGPITAVMSDERNENVLVFILLEPLPLSNCRLHRSETICNKFGQEHVPYW
jgi:hypothetical protein